MTAWLAGLAETHRQDEGLAIHQTAVLGALEAVSISIAKCNMKDFIRILMYAQQKIK